MEKVVDLIIGLMAVIFVVAIVMGVFAFLALVLWGAGSAIVYLFALPVVWTFKKSFIAILALWCLRAIVRWFF